MHCQQASNSELRYIQNESGSSHNLAVMNPHSSTIQSDKIIYSLSIFTTCIFCLLIFLLTHANYAQAKGQKNIDQLYKQAMRVIDEYKGDRKKLIEASKLLDRIQKKAPNSEHVYLISGRLYYTTSAEHAENLNSEKLQAALSVLSKALKINPLSIDAFFYAGHAFLLANNLGVAKSLSNRMQNIAPKHAKTYLLQAEIGKHESNTSHLIKFSKAAAKVAKNRYYKAMAYENLSAAYNDMRQYDVADNYFKKSTEVLPESHWALLEYANFLLSVKRLDDAILYAQRSLNLSETTKGHKVLGKAYFRKGMDLYWKKTTKKQGVKFLEKSVRENDNHSPSHYALGIHLYKEGYLNKDPNTIFRAEKHLTRAVELDENNIEARKSLKEIRQLAISLRHSRYLK